MYIQSMEQPPFSSYYDITDEVKNLKNVTEVRLEYEKLMEIYGDLISEVLKAKAFGLRFGRETSEEYDEYFLSNILMDAYIVFKSGAAYEDNNYYEILKRMKEYNPDWVNAFVRRHDTRVKIFEDARRNRNPFRPSQ